MWKTNIMNKIKGINKTCLKKQFNLLIVNYKNIIKKKLMQFIDSIISNIDAWIVVMFLAINLCVGFYFGRGIKNLKEYALGKRNFSTITLS